MTDKPFAPRARVRALHDGGVEGVVLAAHEKWVWVMLDDEDSWPTTFYVSDLEAVK